MKKKEKFHLFHKLKRRIYYSYIRFFRTFLRILYAKKKHQYLFVLSPPYAGSTMLNQLISSSENVSCNNNLGTREGQLLPGVRHFMFQKDRWDDNIKYPWEDVKKVWRKYWDFSKPIFLDKSIPNIMRVDEIEKVFYPIKYLCMVRNPYAQVEGIMRRNNQDAKSAAEFAIKCLYFQDQNRNRENALFFTYEQLCENGKDVLKQIIESVPELSDISVDMEFTSHNFKSDRKMKMVNLNEEKINKITKEDLKIINLVFSENKDLLDKFNYKIRER